MEPNYLRVSHLHSSNKFPRIRSSNCFLSGLLVFSIILVLVNGVFLTQTETSRSRLLSNDETGNFRRGPRILTDLSSLYKQGCLAKLLCGVNVAKPPSTSTSPLNDYAYMVKSIFENFSIKGIAKSVSSIRKAQEVNKMGEIVKISEPHKVIDANKGFDRNKIVGNGNKIHNDNQESASTESDGSSSVEKLGDDENVDENSSAEMSSLEELHKNFGDIKQTVSPSKLPGLEAYYRRRIATITNPRFDKTMYLDRKQKEFSLAHDDSEKLSIAEEVGKRFRSARQCRAFGLLDRVTRFSLCPFQPADLQRIILKSSDTSSLTSTSTTPGPSQFLHKTNKLRHLQNHEDENSSEEDYNSGSAEMKRMGVDRPKQINDRQSQRILEELLSGVSLGTLAEQFGTGSLTNLFNTGGLTQDYGTGMQTRPYVTGEGATTQNPYYLQLNKLNPANPLSPANKLAAKLTLGGGAADGYSERKKGGKGKGGNTENVNNPNIFHNENHVNIISVNGYPKKKKKKENTEEDEENHHGWINPYGWNSRYHHDHDHDHHGDHVHHRDHIHHGGHIHHGDHIHHRHSSHIIHDHDHKWENSYGWKHSHDEEESEENSDEYEGQEDSDEKDKFEIESYNRSSVIKPQGMHVALSMNPTFSISNAHGNAGGGSPFPALPKTPMLLPNVALPELPGLLPELPKRNGDDDDTENITYEEREDAEPEKDPLEDLQDFDATVEIEDF